MAEHSSNWFMRILGLVWVGIAIKLINKGVREGTPFAIWFGIALIIVAIGMQFPNEGDFKAFLRRFIDKD